MPDYQEPSGRTYAQLSRLPNGLVAHLLIFLTSVLAISISFVGFSKGPMYGDDYLLVRDALQRMPGEDFINSFLLSGGGKWRPLSTPFLLTFARWSGFEYLPHQLVSLTLLFMTTYLSGVSIYLYSRQRVASMTGAFLVGLSPFTYLMQTSVYGAMEFSAAALVIAGLCCFVYLETKPNSMIIRPGMVPLCLVLSSLVHERFLLTCLLFSFVAVFSPRYKRYARSVIVFLIFYVLLKGFLLGLDPLQGGGESNFRAVAGWWVIAHYLDALSGVFARFGGSGLFFNEDLLSSSAQDVNLGWLCGPIPLMFAFAVGLLIFWFKDGIRKVAWSSIGAFGLVGLLMLVPASLVIQRIEARWLYVPHVCLVTATVMFASHSKPRSLVQLLMVGCFLIALSQSLHYRTKAEDPLAMRNQFQLAIDEIDNFSPRSGPWALVVYQPAQRSSVRWQTAYSYAFNQLRNPPYSVVYGTPDSCSTMSPHLACVVVQFNGLQTVRVSAEKRKLSADSGLPEK